MYESKPNETYLRDVFSLVTSPKKLEQKALFH